MPISQRLVDLGGRGFSVGQFRVFKITGPEQIHSLAEVVVRFINIIYIYIYRIYIYIYILDDFLHVYDKITVVAQNAKVQC